MFAPTFRRILLLAALPALAPLLVEDDPVLLRWNLKAGEVLRYRLTMAQELTTSLPPDAGIENELAMVLRQEVREVAADGTGSIDFGYEAVRMQVGGDEPRSYDSTRTGEDAKANDVLLGEMFAPLLEVKLTMKLEPTGRVSGFEGIDAVLEQMLSAQEAKPATAEMLKGMFREEELRRMMEMNVFPEKALAKGDSWQREMDLELPMLGTLEIAIRNEFAGLEQRAGEPCARIALEAEIAFEATEAAADSPMKLSLGESAGTGSMLFGVAPGRVLESDFDMRMEMDATLPALEEDAGLPKTMKMKVHMAIRARLLGEGEPAFE